MAYTWRRLVSVAVQLGAGFCAVAVLLPLVLIFANLLTLGFSSLNLNFFTEFRSTM